MIRIDNLTFRIAGQTIIDQASANLPTGSKVGLVGRNGAGKSTLLNLITGELSPSAGDISLPNRAQLATLAQEAPSGPQSIIDTVLAADRERRDLMAQAETETDPQGIAEIHERLSTIDAYRAPARAAAILAGLGIDEARQQDPVDSLSGGWRMRVALAAALFQTPDILLLDEPTNHLDLEAAIWLEGFLAKYRHTLILVSHDRNLLDTVVGQILHVDRGKLNLYRGNYSQFEAERRRRHAFAAKALEKQLAQRRHMEAFVERFRSQANKARQAQSRLKALERLQPLEPIVEDQPVFFDFPQPDELPPPLITMDGVAVGYDDSAVLTDLNLRIDMDDRIALLGANGNGKSTLAKLLAGRLQSMHGSFTRHRKLEIGYFAQHQIEDLVPTDTPFGHMSRLMPDAAEAKIRAQLGRFDFCKSQADTKVRDLSGGEKARLALALISHTAPHILILDEPTNHLDIDRREALVQALNTFAGAVVLVTHDPHLIELVADRLWVVRDGTVQVYDGDLDSYRREALEAARNAGQRPASKTTGSGATHMTRRRKKRASRAATERAVETAESRLAKLHAARDKISTALADPNLYGDNAASHQRVSELNQLLTKVSGEIDAAETAWLSATDALDSTGEQEA